MDALARCFIATLLISGLLGWNVAAAEPAIGWVDTASIYPGPIMVHARMDSGAHISSLRVDDSRDFKVSGQAWIRVKFTDKEGQVHTLERRVVRNTKIKRHNGGPEWRPVILLGICVGKVYKEVEATIVDRGEFNYPLLVGRDFLAGSFLIDSGRTFTVKPTCKQIPQ